MKTRVVQNRKWVQAWLGPLALVGVLLVSGCVSSRAFVPGEHLTAFSPRGGHYAAEYGLMEEGQAVADVKLWSEGATRKGGSGEQTLVQVGFELDNHGAEPLELDTEQLVLEELPEKGEARGRVEPRHVEGETIVPPGESRQVEVSFALPPSVWPSDVPGFRLAWRVKAGRVHSRRTPFYRALDARDTYPYYSPFYGSYYYPGGYWPGSMRYRTFPPPWGGRRYYYYGPR